MRSQIISALLTVVGGVGIATSVEGAVLTANYIDAPPSSTGHSRFVNFADEGTLDWALWNPAAAGAHSGEPTLEKAGANFISIATVVGNGALQRVAPTDLGISTTPGATSGADAAGAVSSSILKTAGEGAGLTITVPTTGEYIARVYVGGYKAWGDLSATLPGADPVLLTEVFGETLGGRKHAGVFELTFQPDAVDGVSNVLSVTIALNSVTSTSDSNPHVLLQGATLVPEPTAVGALAIAGMGLLARRRSH